MTEKLTLLAVFADIDPAAHGIDKLRELGVDDDQMNVISGIPVTEAMLGRPRKWSNVPRLAAGRRDRRISAGSVPGCGHATALPDQCWRPANPSRPSEHCGYL